MNAGPELVCDLTALPSGGRERITALSRELFSQAGELRTLPDGFEVGYPAASSKLFSQLAEFIALDRLCCPFVRHGLFVEPYEKVVWLHLSGGEGVRDAIESDIMRFVPDEVAPGRG